MASNAASEKTSKWDNEGHTALCVALVEALVAAGGSVRQQSDVIMASLQASGSRFTWEAVR